MKRVREGRDEERKKEMEGVKVLFMDAFITAVEGLCKDHGEVFGFYKARERFWVVDLLQLYCTRLWC